MGTRETVSQNPLFATPFRHPASVGHLTDCVKISSLIWSHQSPLVYPPFFGIPNLPVSIGILQSYPLPVPVYPALTIPAPTPVPSFSTALTIPAPPLCRVSPASTASSRLPGALYLHGVQDGEQVFSDQQSAGEIQEAHHPRHAEQRAQQNCCLGSFPTGTQYKWRVSTLNIT